MAVAFEQFIQGLEHSGIISPGDLRAVCEKLPHDRQHDAQELARELVRQKILTTYQVKEAYQGKAKDLVLGNYTILDQIGQGGMGQVFKAQHRRMDRIVAIKMLPAAVTKDNAAVARFEREVKAAAKLEHPNIVTAHDADEANGRHFLVMQYVEGTDLSALVKKNGPLPVEQAVSCITQAARGLEYAHGEGVVHRDIKPANLLLDKKGVVKILDMGLARLESAAGADQAELTGTGQIMGTVDYMSPEQALDTKHADERSDIYSLGCTLWYLLTGHSAFGGESVMAKLLAHREQPIPSLQAACPGVTPVLETVFTKMMAKKEEDRYQSMSEVVVELERIRPDQDVAGPVGDEEGEDHRRSEFLGGTKPSRAASGHPPGKPVATAKRPSSTVLEATITMADGKIETDPKTEQSLVVPAAVRTWWRKVAEFVRIPSIEAQDRNSHEFRYMRARRTWVLTACVAVAVLLLVATVLYRWTKPATVQPLPRTAQGTRPHLLPAVAPFDAKQAATYQEAWAKHLGAKIEIENSLGMKLRLVPPGEFMMGSPREEIDALVATTTDPNWQGWYRSEGPAHRVKLTQAFYLGRCEVTQRQYQELMGANRSHFSSGGAGKAAVKDLATRQFPVEMVSWFDVVDFCNKLSEKEQRPAYYLRDGEAVKVLGGTGYRLPTEAEWEYACRAGTTTRWSFGDNELDLATHGWFRSNSAGLTHRVGELPANPFGLHDLHGNVWEWCSDLYGGYAAEAVSDPTGPTAGSGRVLRGGACDSVASYCRSAYRDVDVPLRRYGLDGFRVCCGR